MKLALALSPVAIAATAACASSQPSPDATTTAQPTTAQPTTTVQEPGEAEIRAIAEKAARVAGYDLGVYRIKDVSLSRSRAPNPDWVVFFEHEAPAPPGGHFTVYVNQETKETQLVPGR